MQKTRIEIMKTAQVLKLLGDKTRLTIVSFLLKRECCVCELVELFDMSQPSISQHLRKLKDGGLILEERKGQWIYYSLNKSSDCYPLVVVILQHVLDENEMIKSQVENDTKLRFEC